MSESAITEGLRGLRLLVVENDARTAMHLSEAFRRAGVQRVEIKASAWQARQRLQQPPVPHVVLLDYSIVGADTGLDVALWMREQPALAQTVRILYTGTDVEQLQARLPDEHVFQRILHKPLSLPTLIEQVAAVVREQQMSGG